MTTEEKNEALFVSLVMMFQAAAMQHMGKVKNPATDKVERNLDQAQMSIDLLDMLLTKTKNNLKPDAERFLKDVLQDLKLNYVDEISKDSSEQAKGDGA
ncbi:MAG: DUF1844 domain-containing protein [Ignavibacteriales bacterium]|nr:DUF1844 domain-containing protein [Ignavibacteriales bacterium]